MYTSLFIYPSSASPASPCPPNTFSSQLPVSLLLIIHHVQLVLPMNPFYSALDTICVPLCSDFFQRDIRVGGKTEIHP